MMNSHGWSCRNCNNCSNAVSTGLFILRVAVGCLFLWHANMKFGAGPEVIQFVGGAAYNLGLTFFSVETWFEIAKYGELVGGILLVFGLWSRFASSVLIIVMLLAANVKGRDITAAELDILFLASLIALNFTGAGRRSLAAALCKHPVTGPDNTICSCCGDNCECGDCTKCQPKPIM